MKKLIIPILVLATITLSAATSPYNIRVPRTVECQIKADAEREWPGDYKMQVYMIDNQTAAYKEVQAWLKNNRRNRICVSIHERAVRDWPGDYKMQLYTIKNEFAAYNKIHGD